MDQRSAKWEPARKGGMSDTESTSSPVRDSIPPPLFPYAPGPVDHDRYPGWGGESSH